MASRPVPARPRPLSPFLIYRWGPAMLVSIVHRATGVGMALVGLPMFVWWLAALAGGPADYAAFQRWFTTDAGALNALGWVIGVGLSLAFFQHLASGIRHLVMDTGALFELRANRRAAALTFVASVALTALFWFVVAGRSL